MGLLIEQIELTTSPKTYTFEPGTFVNKTIFLYGTHTMAGAISIDLGTPIAPSGITILYSAELSNYSIGSNYLSIAGNKLPLQYADKKCVIRCQWDDDNDVWVVWFIPSVDETAWIVAGDLSSGSVTTAKLDTTGGSEAVNTSAIRASAVTNAKMANMADQTIKGNVSGGSAAPSDLTATNVRTLLDQDVTLTGHVTGTATQDAATGVTTVATTISNNTITVAMCTNTVNTDLVTIPVSLETNALTAGNAYIAVKVPYACTIEEWGFSVSELIEATDDATISLYNTAGTLMGSSAVIVTKNTKPSTSAAGGSFFNSSSITSNNSISAANLFYIRVQKTTAGGKGFANIKIKRA